MRPFTVHTGLVAPLDRSNVDTDAILPKQFLRSIHRTGFGVHLFDEWRYLDRGELGMDAAARPLNQTFVLNQPRYRGASILLGRQNFGTGSSREHAAWALDEYGFRAVIAPSFADIFADNCLRNGLALIVLPDTEIDALFAAVTATTGYTLTIDLAAQQVRTPEGCAIRFEIDAAHKARLLAGLDDIGTTLTHADEIRAFEARRFAGRPWLDRALR